MRSQDRQRRRRVPSRTHLETSDDGRLWKAVRKGLEGDVGAKGRGGDDLHGR